MVTALKSLQVATTALCLDLNVSVSQIYPVVNGLLKKHLVIGSDELPVVKRFKELITGELHRRFQQSVCQFWQQLSILDTRN